MRSPRTNSGNRNSLGGGYADIPKPVEHLTALLKGHRIDLLSFWIYSMTILYQYCTKPQVVTLLVYIFDARINIFSWWMFRD